MGAGSVPARAVPGPARHREGADEHERGHHRGPEPTAAGGRDADGQAPRQDRGLRRHLRRRDRRAHRRRAAGEDRRVPRALRRRRVAGRPAAARRSPWSARPRPARWASSTTRCSSWAAPPCTRATSPRCAPARARPWSRRCPPTSTRSPSEGVHVVTVNDYLAQRDSQWMGRVHRFLGLEVGAIFSGMPADRAAGGLRGRHHLRHEQRVRLRLPARQHGLVEGRVRAARPRLRDRRRGRLDPHRRGPHPADHLRARRAERALVHRVRAPRPEDDQGRPLRGRRAQEDHRGHRGGRVLHRGPAGHRQPLRGREHPARRLPEQRDQGQGALPPRQGLHRPRRRGPDRRRVHRPRARGPALQRGPAPGDRGQGRRRDQGRRTRRWPRSRCRTTSATTRSSAG